jgi:hypothetical protein
VTDLPEINKDGTIELPKDDGLPGSSESGIPAATDDSKKKRRQRRGAEHRRLDGP